MCSIIEFMRFLRRKPREGYINDDALRVVTLFKAPTMISNGRVYCSVCRRTEDGEITASGERIQSPTHAPQPHAVHAARRASRCRTHRYPVTGQSATSPASASTGSRRAGPQGQSKYDQHGSPREVSFSLPFWFRLACIVRECVCERERKRNSAVSLDERLRKLRAAGNIFINFLPELYESTRDKSRRIKWYNGGAK